MIVDAEIFKLFALVLVRFSGLILTAPILGSNNFPVIGKIGLVGLSAMVVTPTVAALDTTLASSPLEFGIMAIGDLMIGMLLGLVMTLMFAASDMGYATSPMIGFDPQAVGDLIGLDANHIPVLLIAIGKQVGDLRPRSARLPVNEVVRLETMRGPGLA